MALRQDSHSSARGLHPQSRYVMVLPYREVIQPENACGFFWFLGPATTGLCGVNPGSLSSERDVYSLRPVMPGTCPVKITEIPGPALCISSSSGHHILIRSKKRSS
jgi:hypothetical protein